MYTLLIGKGLLYYRSLRYNSNVLKYEKFLEQSQWWPSDQIEKLQNERLRLLIKQAGENVPFYRRLFKELRINTEEFSLGQLNLIPPITKDVIKANYEDFVAVNAHNYPHRKANTSGSTGSPFNYLQDLDANEMHLACSYRGMRYAGYHYGDKIIQIAGSAIIPGNSLTRRQKLSNLVQRIKSLPAIKLDADKMNYFVNEINAFAPSFIRGYPSSIYIMANYIKENERNLRCFPKAIITTAEVLLPKYKEKIEDTFRCPVFNEYGCNDGGLISYECNRHDGFHYAAEKAIVEVAEDNQSTLPEKYGEVMLTDLYNFSMPFIRYKNGDIAKLAGSDCMCGRSLPRIEKVQGRSGDILKFNDRYLSTPALTLIFKDFNLDHYQLIKKADNLLVIKAIKGKAFKTSEENRLLAILRYHLGNGVHIEMDFVTNIETTASGKLKFFIDMSMNN